MYCSTRRTTNATKSYYRQPCSVKHSIAIVEHPVSVDILVWPWVLQYEKEPAYTELSNIV